MPKVIDDKDVYRAAINVLSAYGYESAATKTIADSAGIHEATLFRKYESKFNLFKQTIKSQFLDVPLAQVTYTGDLKADLISIIEAYIKTSEMVGNILPILLIEIPRNPELKELLEIPWENISRIADILEQYQAQHKLKHEPILTSISALLGPLMVEHLISQADLDLTIPPIEPHLYVENFLMGRQT
jgi:AcrR family transcriptional regulator